jgi:hypothetical protein
VRVEHDGTPAGRGILRAVLVTGGVFAVLCGGFLTWGVVEIARFDAEAAPVADPAHLGHPDVLVVDSKDRVVRGRVVADYEGRFAKDPRWEGCLRAVEEEVPAALRDVREQLGLGGRPVPPFVVRFRDDEQMGFQLFMSTFQEVRGKEVLPLVVVGVDALLSGACDYREALRHEIAHCLHLAAAGDAFYGYPHWVNEGLADWATGRKGWRMDWLYATECDGPGWYPPGLVDGLEGGTARADYAEYYLAFAYVEDAFGTDAVRKLVAGLFDCTAVHTDVRNATGLSFPEFKNRAWVWAADYVRRDMADYPAYLRAKEPFRKGAFAGADQAYGAYLGGKGPLHFRLNALVEQAECRIGTGDAAGARRLLDQAAGTEPVGPLNDRILQDRARAAGVEGDSAAAESLCLDFIRDFAGYDAARTRAVRKLLEESRKR